MPHHSVPNYRENDTGRALTRDTVGTVVSATGISAQEFGDYNEHRTVITLKDFLLATADVGGTSGTGSQKLYDFPREHVILRGALFNLTTLAGAGGIADTAALVGSVGSAAVGVDNATLTSTEADIIPSTAGTLAAGAGMLRNTGSTVGTALDGITSLVSAYLNIAIPDAGSSAVDTLLLNGTITLFWSTGG